jgi:hypothetical protein
VSNKQESAPELIGVRVLDLHLPVVAGDANEGGLSARKPLAYGTAFPVLPGVFVTAAHVISDARADGALSLSWMTPDRDVKVFPIVDCERFSPVDLAICHCPDLQQLTPISLDFDHTLDLLVPSYAIGFPYAVDPEWVTMAPRAFRGYVVTRRELYHLPAQPPGYEVSFPAPQGLSGAPLVSHVQGDHRAYGYVIQQGVLGVGEHQAVVGVAVSIEVLLSIRTNINGIGALALAFGREPRELPPPSKPRRPGGVTPVDDMTGWPDDHS